VNKILKWQVNELENKMWEQIHELYMRMERFCGKSLYLPEELLYGNAVVQKNGDDVSREAEREYSLEDMIALRAELRNQLDFLKVELNGVFNERDIYMILFPLVAQIDEIIQNNILRTINVHWPLLQSELFQIENAGDVFYEILDNILNKPQTPGAVYEMYYFCLRYGFRGRYATNPAKIVDYIKHLREKLEMPEKGKDILIESESSGQVRKVIRPHWYYLIAAGVFLFVYLGLILIADKI
jgi:type IV/VI secretion system ImpK/VasF family protein